MWGTIRGSFSFPLSLSSKAKANSGARLGRLGRNRAGQGGHLHSNAGWRRRAISAVRFPSRTGGQLLSELRTM